MAVKKKAIEKVKKINEYDLIVKDLHRPIPSEIKRVELEMINKRKETKVREKKPYPDYIQHVREENKKIKKRPKKETSVTVDEDK